MEQNKANHISTNGGHVLLGNNSSLTNIEKLVIETGINHGTLGLATYFQAAIRRLNYLEYGDPSEFVSIRHSSDVPNCSLDSVWVPSRFRKQEETGEDISFDTFLGDPSTSQVILGDPGCGKSTLSRFITCFMISRFCNRDSKSFGIYVPLNAIRVSSGHNDVDAIVHCAAKYVGLEGNNDVLMHLKEHISNAYVILDGLDEVPIIGRNADREAGIPSRSQIVELIKTLQLLSSMQMGGGPAKIFVTSRIKDYFENRSLILGNTPTYFISKFSPDQMLLAVNKWHEAAQSSIVFDLEDVKYYNNRRVAIQSALRNNQDLAHVCLTPLMLSAFLTVYTDSNDIPASVSHLCWRSVKWFLADKYKNNGKGRFISEHADTILGAVVELGWVLQENVTQGLPKSFGDDTLRHAVKKSCLGSAHFSRLLYEEKENLITKVVSFLRDGHGIIVNISNQEFDFSEDMFRDVLSGKALDKLTIPQRRSFVLDKKWISPIRYWAGLKAGEGGGLFEINTFVGELMNEIEAENIQACIACGEMLSEVVSVVKSKDLPIDLAKKIIIVKEKLSFFLKHDNLGLEDRIKIGDIFSVLGDPKLEAKPIERIGWIPEGEYTIGRSKNHVTRIPKYEKCPASPPISGKLRDYGMGSYLVTNHEYEQFIDSGGYKNPRYWVNEIAWGWASRKKDVMDILIEEATGLAPFHFITELINQRFVQDEMPDRCVAMIDRSLPLYWADPAFNRSNQPVVGVNWWECIAYCRWLTDLLHKQEAIRNDQIVRLPTEAEWEVAAQLSGNGGQYPWVKGHPPLCSLLKSSFLASETPPMFRSCGIGLFQFVESAYPIFDMVGNVWEWTSSKATPYSPETFDQLVEYDGLDERIARGSSWLSSEEEASQITFRSFDPPYNAYEDLGFRIVII